MEIPPSSTAGVVVFLLESKNWENGSNNYVTDATPNRLLVLRDQANVSTSG